MEEQRQRQEEDARRVQTETMPTVPGECVCVCVCMRTPASLCVFAYNNIFVHVMCYSREYGGAGRSGSSWLGRAAL